VLLCEANFETKICFYLVLLVTRIVAHHEHQTLIRGTRETLSKLGTHCELSTPYSEKNDYIIYTEHSFHHHQEHK